MPDPIRIYGSRCGYRCGNSGDEASVSIVAALAGRRAVFTGIRYADMTACGSVLEDVPAEYAGWIWGTGLMFERSRLAASGAAVAAVRGLLTAARIPQRQDFALGDPGLLLADLFPVARTSRYQIGFVPHYVDANDQILTEWIRRNEDGIATVIDICQHPEQVLAQIAECEFIVSSSLHGLVFADALGIPNAWIASDKVNGAGFKFRDYWSAFGIADMPSLPFDVATPLADILARAGDYHRPGLEQIKDALIESFPWHP